MALQPVMRVNGLCLLIVTCILRSIESLGVPPTIAAFLPRVLDAFSWDPDMAQSDIRVSQDGKVARNLANGCHQANAVRGTAGWSTGIHIWGVEVVSCRPPTVSGRDIYIGLNAHRASGATLQAL